MIFLIETIDFLKTYQNGLEVLKNISLMTYCSLQFGGFNLFVSIKDFVDAELFCIFLLTCLFVTPSSFFFSHPWYFGSSSQLRRLRLVCCYGISDEGMSEAAAELPLLEELDITLCPLSKESLEAVGRCCPLLKSIKWNRQWYAAYGFLRLSVMRRQLLLQRTCLNYVPSRLLEIS